jgi:hypothetical protein
LLPELHPTPIIKEAGDKTPVLVKLQLQAHEAVVSQIGVRVQVIPDPHGAHLIPLAAEVPTLATTVGVVPGCLVEVVLAEVEQATPAVEAILLAEREEGINQSDSY